MKRAFSLVEVVLALGIVSISLLATVGMMSVGLKVVKNANEQAGAGAVLEGLSDALRNASSTNGSVYSSAFAGKPITFSVDQGTALPAIEWKELDLTGSSNSSDSRLFARLEIYRQPTANPPAPGRAILSVAWSARTPSLAWDETKKQWNNAEGSITTGLQFLPKP